MVTSNSAAPPGGSDPNEDTKDLSAPGGDESGASAGAGAEMQKGEMHPDKKGKDDSKTGDPQPAVIERKTFGAKSVTNTAGKGDGGWSNKPKPRISGGPPKKSGMKYTVGILAAIAVLVIGVTWWSSSNDSKTLPNTTNKAAAATTSSKANTKASNKASNKAAATTSSKRTDKTRAEMNLEAKVMRLERELKQATMRFEAAESSLKTAAEDVAELQDQLAAADGTIAVLEAEKAAMMKEVSGSDDSDKTE